MVTLSFSPLFIGCRNESGSSRYIEAPDILLAKGAEVPFAKSQFPDSIVLPRSLFFSSDHANVLVGPRQYSDILHAVMNDCRVLYLSERSWGRGLVLQRGLFSQLIHVEQLVHATICRTLEYGIRQVFMGSTPHSAETFIFARVAELLGVSVVYARATAAPWRLEACTGLDDPTTLRLRSDPSAGEKADLLLAVNRYLASLAERKETGRLASQRSQRELAGGDRPSWRVARQQSVEVIRRYGLTKKGLSVSAATASVNHLERSRLYGAYSSLAGGVVPRSEKVLAVFLHFQPERTSMPEGGIYAQQLALVRTLSLALPSGWRILVREHPSIFRGPNVFSRRYRSPEFYKALAGLRNVQLTPMSTSPAELLDHASCVATITGTVGLEALAMGLPVIAFGGPAWSNAPGVLRVGPARSDAVGNIGEFLAAIDDHARSITLEGIRDFVVDSAANGRGPVDSAEATNAHRAEAIAEVARDWLAWAKSGAHAKLDSDGA